MSSLQLFAASLLLFVLWCDCDHQGLRHPFSLLGNNSARIINGVDVPEGRWPFMVSLLFRGTQHFCGGSILNDDSILTAGHCLVAEDITAPNVQVYLGHVDLDSKDSKYLFQAAAFHPHEQFNVKALAQGHDVGVIKLARKIDFRELSNVAKVCLPESEDPLTEKCVVMGWGITEGGSASSKLMQVDVPILSDSDCAKYGGDYQKETLFCAGYATGGKDSCQGDSGGPLVCPSQSDPNTYLQYGIVSYGDGCAKKPGFYTRDAALLEWIRSKAEA